jgi:hypothetical protein
MTAAAMLSLTINSAPVTKPTYTCAVKSSSKTGETLTVTIKNFSKGQSVNVSCGEITHP